MNYSPPSTRRIVILGTGTDVGKTYVGVTLTRALRARGHDVLALKPVESGLGAGGAREQPVSGDAHDLAEAATRGASPRFALSEPISPHLAARKEGVHILIEDVLAWIEEQERRFLAESPREPFVLIETAGGCFSPLSEESTNFDLARRLDPAAWVLIAPDSLGVLHDVQATLRATAERAPEYLVVSQARPADASTGTNAEELQRVVLSQLRGTIPLPRVSVVPKNGSATALANDLIVSRHPQPAQPDIT